ncbi:hypothetical protein PDO_3009 [Rhizobium sp. PDO1-076]|uniref:molybdopterin cofactor-binding domain-containing protein n=1 Tax=Rhizobium sp. PDO1-076 TaxID=1125979 RepID=UPI00024E2F53|nr:molybdopterin cofactor-binding domain-containing protein [Rhizobium sp. PDO1-076]EHS49747.1 hypothetical protein PDO_3009 [Rhizobium sp. PDO1-076]
MIPNLMNKFANPVQPAVSRRNFLLGALATAGGLAVGFRVLEAIPAEAATDSSGKAANAFSPYVLIDADGKVTVLSSQFEMGQGSYNGIGTLVAEELDADWSTIEVVGAAGDVKSYGNIAFGGALQGTGGSTSMFTSWDRYRQAGAATRAMLVAAAAAEWSRPRIRDHGGKWRAQACVRQGKWLRRACCQGSNNAGSRQYRAQAASRLETHRQ